MALKTLYTAVGRFERRTNGCRRYCPVIILGGKDHSTIKYGVEKIEKEMAKDETLHNTISIIMKKINPA